MLEQVVWHVLGVGLSQKLTMKLGSSSKAQAILRNRNNCRSQMHNLREHVQPGRLPGGYKPFPSSLRQTDMRCKHACIPHLKALEVVRREREATSLLNHSAALLNACLRCKHACTSPEGA